MASPGATTFSLFQRLPMEIQISIWKFHQLSPRMIQLNRHARRRGAAYDADERYTSYTNPELMDICKSARMAYGLQYKLFDVGTEICGPSLAITDGKTIRVNPTSDILSQQFCVIIEKPADRTPGEPWAVVAQPGRFYPRHLDWNTRIPVRPLSTGATPPGTPASNLSEVSEVSRHTEQHDFNNIPSPLQHLHIDLLVFEAGGPSGLTMESGTTSLEDFSKFAAGPDMHAEVTNMRTITITTNGPGAHRCVLRLVPSAMHSPPLDSGWAEHIRSDGAASSVPTVRNNFSLYRVVAPLGDKIEPGDDWTIETWENDEKMWREAVSTGRINHWHSQQVPLEERLANATVDRNGLLSRSFELDGVCGPNYGMGDAKVF